VTTRQRIGRITLIAAALATSALLVGVASYVSDQRQFDAVPAGECSPRAGQSQPVTIALIGDSWVAQEHLDGHLEAVLEGTNLEGARIRSFGQGGAVSRAVFRNLFAPPTDPNSSSAVREDPSILYGVVVVGVNDTALHIGSDFYAHHVAAIATALLQCGITPVLLEVPEYGIEHLDAIRSSFGKLRERLYRSLFDGGVVDGIETYRNALREKLEHEGLSKRVVLVDSSEFARDYNASKDLYRNVSHPNDQGNQKLAELIGASIVRREAMAPSSR
jgi:hypothetical protein